MFRILRLFSALLLITAQALAQFADSPAEIRLTELRHEAESNNAKVDAAYAALKAGKGVKREDEDQYWTQHRYWFYYFGVVDDLKAVVFRHKDGPTAAERLEATKKAERDAHVRVEIAPDGKISYRPGIPSYNNRNEALKNAAAMDVYSKLQGYDLKSGAVITGGAGAGAGTTQPVK